MPPGFHPPRLPAGVPLRVDILGLSGRSYIAAAAGVALCSESARLLPARLLPKAYGGPPTWVRAGELPQPPPQRAAGVRQPRLSLGSKRWCVARAPRNEQQHPLPATVLARSAGSELNASECPTTSRRCRVWPCSGYCGGGCSHKALSPGPGRAASQALPLGSCRPSHREGLLKGAYLHQSNTLLTSESE